MADLGLEICKWTRAWVYLSGRDGVSEWSGFNLLGQLWLLVGTFSWMRRQCGNYRGTDKVKIIYNALKCLWESAILEADLPS